jgi:starch synthase
MLTHVRNREAIERVGWREGREYTALDNEAIARPLWRLSEGIRRATGLGWTATTAFAAIPYYYFEHLVWRQFGQAIRARQFDIVHRVTPLTPTTPSLLASRCRAVGVPFVWGPINGGVPWPRHFAGVQRSEGEWLAYVRKAHQLMPGYRSSRRDAAAILVGSRATWAQLRAVQEKCVYLPENGIDCGRFCGRPKYRAPGPLRIVFVGRLVPYKGADILVEAAVPLVRSRTVVVDILGDGPQMGALRRLIAEARVEDGVRLHGWVSHSGIAERLASSDVFAFPSIREFGGGAVLEAMAMGVVPIIVDYAGPGELVTDETGYRIALGPRPAIVTRLREVLALLATKPERLLQMGERAQQRVRALFTWQAKAQQVLEVYSWVLGSKHAKPDFGMPFPDPLRARAPRPNQGS